MLLTMKERQRIEIIQAVMDGRLLVKEAASVLDRTMRQIYRMLRKIREEGLAGLVHKNKGKPNPRRVREKLRQKIIELARVKYANVNDTHLRELLKEREGICMGRETLRSLLRFAGIAAKRQRRQPRYRSRRERKEAFGMMLQIDASPHDWLEGRGPWLTLVGAIDDATGNVWAHFEEAETTWAYLDLMMGVIVSEGIPLSLYSDRHGIFHAFREPTIIEQLNNTRPLTQFGRAMDDLGISLIKAWSPQAKGRIERLWGTFQDRLTVEMRLADARDIKEANEVLEKFLKNYNRRFVVKPRQPEKVFRKAPAKSVLERILCLKETRVVNNDHTISFEGLILQIPSSKKFRSLAKQKVEVLQLKDGSVEIKYKRQIVARFSPEAITRLAGKDNKSQLKIVNSGGCFTMASSEKSQYRSFMKAAFRKKEPFLSVNRKTSLTFSLGS